MNFHNIFIIQKNKKDKKRPKKTKKDKKRHKEKLYNINIVYMTTIYNCFDIVKPKPVPPYFLVVELSA